MPKDSSSIARFARQTRVVVGATLLSRVFGLIREQVIAYYFGAGALTDAYVAAFRIPNLLRDLFAEGAFSAAFVPTFSRVLEKDGKAAAFDLLNRVLSLFVPILVIVCALGMIFTPHIAGLLSGGVEGSPGKIALLIRMARWMFPFLLLVSVASVMMGALNSLSRFGMPALAPTGFNLGVIIGATVLSTWADPSIVGLAWGVVLGGVLQWGFQAVSLHRLGFRHAIAPGWRDSNVHHIARLILPSLVGTAAVQINIFAITRLAWSLGDGPVAYLNYAYLVIFLPLGVFAVATATVGLPRLSQLVAAGDAEEMRRTFRQGVQTVLYLVIPTALAFMILGQPICAALFQRGRFDAAASMHTARALGFYAIGLLAMATIRVTTPLFYAHHDTRTPALCGVISVTANLIGMSILVSYLGYGGLALSVSCAAIVQITVLLVIAQRRYGPLGLFDLGKSLLTLTVVGLGCVGAGWGAWHFGGFGTSAWSRIGGLALAIFIAALLYLGITWLLGYRQIGGVKVKPRWRSGTGSSNESVDKGGR
ncbi:MAG: murein biosynthesis integral membrane protein MurJ [candidate division Zixibacteria bacterium]|nr:murein biosynthesis integral membrane protein MurJ [candidate division Zixibacteria bacterium]